MHYLKRNASFSILFFLSIIFTLINYIQFFNKIDIYFFFAKIPEKYIFENMIKHVNNQCC